jgi:predicted dehydrogenase
MKIRVGLIGIGYMCQKHLKVLSQFEDVEIKFLYDPDTLKQDEVAVEFSNLFISTNLIEYLNQVDAVFITSPTSSHFYYLKLLLEGEVPYIFVEKPMTATYEEAKKVIDIQSKSQSKIYVGFIERFNPAFIVLTEVFNNEFLISVDFLRSNSSSARIKDVDVVSDLMIHDIDLAIFLNGAVSKVMAEGYYKDGQIAHCNAILVHHNGSISRLQASKISPYNERNVKITTEFANIECDLLNKSLNVIKKISINESEENSKIQSRVDKYDLPKEESLMLEVFSFIGACQGQFDPRLASSWDGLKASEVCEVIQSRCRETFRKGEIERRISSE